MKNYWNIYFKRPGLDPVSVPERTFTTIERDVVDRRDVLLNYNGIMFNAKDVSYCRRVSMPESSDTFPGDGYPEISEEQRQSNLRRLSVLRETFFSRDRRVGKQEWANPYEDDDIRAHMSREERQAFRKAHFDTCLPNHEEEQEAMRRWLPVYRGQVDPRR